MTCDAESSPQELHGKGGPLVTIVVVPRERFSVTRRALESLYANTSCPFRLVYVDGGSPAAIRRYLSAEARARGFTLVRTKRYLVPNEARNIGLGHVRTRYVVFIDNDAVPAPGWLDHLVKCAEETGASLVGPLYCIGRPEKQIVHMAGGLTHIKVEEGQRRFFEEHRFSDRRLEEVRHDLRREPCELLEFHCMLARTEVFERLGPLDEQLLSLAEHNDLCLLVREHGGTVYFEPASVVTYITSGPFRWSDYSFFLRRWSEAWNDASFDHFRRKWSLDDDEPGTRRARRFGTVHRQFLLLPIQRALMRTLGWRWGHWLAHDGLAALEARINRWWVRIDRERSAATEDGTPRQMRAS